MPQPESTPMVNKPARCQHRSATGRQCRFHATNSSSELCPRHSATPSARFTNFGDAPSGRAYDFRHPQGVNNALAVLYTLLTEGRISPRRASVLAYIVSLILRTTPVINDENEQFAHEDEGSDSPATPSSPPSAASSPSAENTTTSAANGDDTDEEDEDDSADEDEEEEGLDVEEEEDEEGDEEDHDAEDEDEEHLHRRLIAVRVRFKCSAVPSGRHLGR